MSDPRHDLGSTLFEPLAPHVSDQIDSGAASRQAGARRAEEAWPPHATARTGRLMPLGNRGHTPCTRLHYLLEHLHEIDTRHAKKEMAEIFVLLKPLEDAAKDFSWRIYEA